MTTCKDINNLLPAYLEDALSPEEKKRVEKHLHTCSRCRQDVADLTKAVGLLRNLEEVEPPPFFEQRIMAAIREENRKKHSILRKFFFPLHIKIPIQALATVFIAVFAFLVYQKSGPEIKQLSPLSTPVTESAKSQVKPEIPREPTVSYPTTPVREATPATPQVRNRGQFVPPPGAGESKQEKIASLPAPLKEEQRPAATALKDTEVMAKAQKSIMKSEAETVSMPPTLPSQQSRKSKMASVGSAVRESKDMMSAPSSLQAREAVQSAPMKRSGLNLMIQVPETNQGRQDIEVCLKQFNARILERKWRGETIFLKIQIDARQIAAFVGQLEDIGVVRTNSKRLEFPAGNVAVDISIDRLP